MGWGNSRDRGFLTNLHVEVRRDAVGTAMIASMKHRVAFDDATWSLPPGGIFLFER